MRNLVILVLFFLVACQPVVPEELALTIGGNSTLEYPVGCTPEDVAHVFVDLANAVNIGNVQKIETLFFADLPPSFVQFASNVPDVANWQVTSDSTQVADFFAQRHQAGERWTLNYLQIGIDSANHISLFFQGVRVGLGSATVSGIVGKARYYCAQRAFSRFNLGLTVMDQAAAYDENCTQTIPNHLADLKGLQVAFVCINRAE